MTVVEGLNGVRAPVVETSCLERRLVEAILSATSLAEAREKSRADEFLLEETFRYSHSKSCFFLSLRVEVLLFLLLSVGGGEEVVVADRDLVVFKGSSFVNGEGSVDPLRVIWVAESERGVSIDLEKGAKEYDGKVLLAKDVERLLEEKKNECFGFMDER